MVIQKQNIRKKLCEEHSDSGLNINMCYIYNLRKFFIPKEKRKIE